MLNITASQKSWNKAFLVLLATAATLLAACGSGGNGAGAESAPAFSSQPPTAAAQGASYTYDVKTGSSATLTLTAAPQGATLSGNTVNWTPSAAQSRIANQFSVTATNAMGSATQFWSVMPAGTVTGTWINTHWTPAGSQTLSGSPTQVTIPPQALIPQSDGSFQTLTGSWNSDGSFTIPNVPAGYYWL